MIVKTWRLELRRRLRRFFRRADIEWPMSPAGIYLNPSDADFCAYDSVPLALTWSAQSEGDPLAWQDTVRSKLRELLGIAPDRAPVDPSPVLGPSAKTDSGLQRQTVYLLAAPRRHIPITIVWDANRADVALPVMICLQGHTSGAHISWGEAREPIDAERIRNGGDFAVQAVRNGHVAICVEQIGFGERQERAIAHRWEHTCIDACNRALLLGRTVLGDRVSDVSSVITWLTDATAPLPSMDVSRIRVMGNSAGGETTLFAAALDRRIEAVIASGCVGAWRKTSGTRKTCPDTVIPGVLAWMEYSDILALCAPRPTLVVSGVDDYIYPYRLAAECAEDARPAFKALNAGGMLQTAAGPAGHRFYPDIAWPLFLNLLGAKK